MGPAAEILCGFDDSSEKALDDLWGRLRHRLDECQQAMRDFESQRQSDSESLAEFEQVLRTLHREAWPDQTEEQRDPVLKRRFEEGVASAELRQYLRLHHRDLNFRQTTEKARIFAATMGETKSKKSVRFMSESPAPAIHHMAVPTIDFTPVLCRLDDIEKKFAGKWTQEPDKAVSACISSPPRQDTTSPTAGRSQTYNSGRGSMPSRGRSSWPGRGGQSVRGRGAFQSREQTQPATPPPSPRLASQNNRLPVRGQTFFRCRGRGRGSVCWVCQREGCFSWNHPPLENCEPPTRPPQDERTPSRRTTSPRPGCYVCNTFGCHSDFHRGDARNVYVPPPFQPSQISLPITEPENGFQSPRPGERAPPVPPRPSSH